MGLDPISRGIVLHGGLFNYNHARLAGEVTPPTLETPARPMTIVEKIIASRAAQISHIDDAITIEVAGNGLATTWKLINGHRINATNLISEILRELL